MSFFDRVADRVDGDGSTEDDVVAYYRGYDLELTAGDEAWLMGPYVDLEEWQ